MTRKHLLLTEEQCDFLANYENESEIVRRALDKYIEEKRSKQTSTSLSKGGENESR